MSSSEPVSPSAPAASSWTSLRWLRSLALGAAALSCACGAAEAPRRSNLVLVSVDTLRADHLSCYGYPRPTSPALDQLAQRSVLFERAYSQSPKTASSHMTLMTGLYPEAHGVTNWREDRGIRLSDSIPTLAELLQQEGYRTIAHADGGNVRPELGFDRGFDAFQSEGGALGIFKRGLQTIAQLAGSEAPGPPPPFFLFLHTYEVHDPYVPPEPFRSRFTDPAYDGAVVSRFKQLLKLAKGGWEQQHALFWEKVDPKRPEDLQHLQDLYDGSILMVDILFGRLVQSLEQRGLLEDTLIVFLSDHGEGFLEHDVFLHNDVYQENLHVPLVIHFPAGADLRDGGDPKNREGRRITEPVQLVDVLPTLLSFLDIPVPAHVQGRSLLPLLRGDAPGETVVMSQWAAEGHHALRLGKWKLLQRPAESGVHEELYHLGDDPAERNDRIRQEDAVAESLRSRLEELREASRTYHSGTAPSVKLQLGDRTRKQLEALGYLRTP